MNQTIKINASQQLKAIVGKELTDALRDGKSLATALLLPIAFAIMSYLSIHFIADTQSKAKGFAITSDNVKKITPIIQWLSENNIRIINKQEDRSSHKPFIEMQVHDEFDSQFRDQKPAIIELHYDQSNTQAQAQAQTLSRLLMQWSSQNSALRLLARNISPDIAQSLQVKHINTTEQARRETKLIASLPIVIMLMAFVGGVGMAAEMAAGERERQSLESLLINPVPRWIIVVGKWLAAVIISLIIAAFGVGLQFIAISQAPLAELDLRIELGLDKYAMMMVILLPVIGLACALQLFVSFLARSFKDSQSYNSLILMLPMAPGIYLILNTQLANLPLMLVPVLGPQILISDLISNQFPQLLFLITSAATSFIITGLLLALTVKLINRESMIR